jgi:hypothetical protein
MMTTPMSSVRGSRQAPSAEPGRATGQAGLARGGAGGARLPGGAGGRPVRRQGLDDRARDRQQPPDGADERRGGELHEQRHVRRGAQRADAGADHGADGERGVELRQHGAAHPALDGRGLDVERHVAQREPDAGQEDAEREERHRTDRRAQADEHVRRREGRGGHVEHEAPAVPVHEHAGDRDGRERPHRPGDEDAAELGGAHVQRVPHGRDAGEPAGEHDADQAEQPEQEHPRPLHGGVDGTPRAPGAAAARTTRGGGLGARSAVRGAEGGAAGTGPRLAHGSSWVKRG